MRLIRLRESDGGKPGVGCIVFAAVVFYVLYSLSSWLAYREAEQDRLLEQEIKKILRWSP